MFYIKKKRLSDEPPRLVFLTQVRIPSCLQQSLKLATITTEVCGFFKKIFCTRQELCTTRHHSSKFVVHEFFLAEKGYSLYLELYMRNPDCHISCTDILTTMLFFLFNFAVELIT